MQLDIRIAIAGKSLPLDVAGKVSLFLKLGYGIADHDMDNDDKLARLRGVINLRLNQNALTSPSNRYGHILQKSYTQWFSLQHKTDMY